MEPKWIFLIVTAGTLACIIALHAFYGMLSDESSLDKKPYSFSRIQLAWWTTIVVSSVITIIFSLDHMPVIPESTLVLLGLSGATFAMARVIDVSDNKEKSTTLSRNQAREGILLDMLSDQNGVSIHRFQALLFNVVFGCWFIREVLARIGTAPSETILPEFSQGSLIMLGLSSATYAALKANENK
jgi:hypothetical protein